jgi:hypothetical protein
MKPTDLLQEEPFLPTNAERWESLCEVVSSLIGPVVI